MGGACQSGSHGALSLTRVICSSAPPIPTMALPLYLLVASWDLSLTHPVSFVSFLFVCGVCGHPWVGTLSWQAWPWRDSMAEPRPESTSLQRKKPPWLKLDIPAAPQLSFDEPPTFAQVLRPPARTSSASHLLIFSFYHVIQSDSVKCCPVRARYSTFSLHLLLLVGVSGAMETVFGSTGH